MSIFRYQLSLSNFYFIFIFFVSTEAACGCAPAWDVRGEKTTFPGRFRNSHETAGRTRDASKSRRTKVGSPEKP